MCPRLSANYVSCCPPNMAQVSVWAGNLQAVSETLIFINTDIFPVGDCIDNILYMLNSNEKIAAVQPMLLYPQTNLVQSTGHVFSEFKSGQLFAYRSPKSEIVKSVVDFLK